VSDTGAITEHHISVRRTARYYTLGSVSDATRELWIACHGYGQLALPFLTSMAKVAAPHRLIVAPEGFSRFYVDRTSMTADPPPKVGASWMTREDRDAEIADQVGYLEALLADVRTRLPGNVRLRVLGFSQGVATVSRWVARGTVRPDELILWAGSFPLEIDPAEFSRRADGVAVTMVFGSRDQLAPIAVGESQRERLTGAGIDARLVSFEGGHRLDDATLLSLASPD
jgi:predicted esterase